MTFRLVAVVGCGFRLVSARPGFRVFLVEHAVLCCLCNRRLVDFDLGDCRFSLLLFLTVIPCAKLCSCSFFIAFSLFVLFILWFVP